MQSRTGITRSGESEWLHIHIHEATVGCMAATAITPRPAWLDFDEIDALCAERGASTELERAELLGVDKSTLNRWRRGVYDITLGRVGELAQRLNVPVATIVMASKPPKQPRPRPTPPNPAPRPPAGPEAPRPPAAPRQDRQP